MQEPSKSKTCERQAHVRVPAQVGERSAVRPKSGKSVHQSDPGLRRPTPPPTVGRKPTARPPILNGSFTPSETNLTLRKAGPSQPKTGRGTGQSPAIQSRREAPGSNAVSSAPRRPELDAL